MATYYAKKIIREEIDGVMCVVKYVDSYSKDTFQEWVKIAKDSYYDVLRISSDRHYALFAHQADNADVIHVDCKMKIRIAWIQEYYPCFLNYLQIVK